MSKKLQSFLQKVKRFWKKAVIITLIGFVYPLWLWKDSDMSAGLLAANVCSVVSLLFFVYGIVGVLHNVHALAAFTYSFRYVAHMVKNARNRDTLTDQEIPSYADYIASYEKWEDVPVAFAFFGVTFVLFLFIWQVFC